MYPSYRIRYTSREEYPTECIPAGRSTIWAYRIGNQRIHTRWIILWAECPQVGVYPKPIYSIISILSYLSYPKWPLSYRIGIFPICRIRYTKPGGVSYGSDARRVRYEMALSNWKPQDTIPGRVSYGFDTYLEEYEMILRPHDTPKLGILWVGYRRSIISLSILSLLSYRSYLSYPTYLIS